MLTQPIAAPAQTGDEALSSLRSATRTVITGRAVDGDPSVGHLSWINRHRAWPVAYADALAAVEPDTDPRAPLAAARLCARRLQYAFAWRLLGEFSEAALLDHPGDPDFMVHHASALAATTRSHDAWCYLAEVAEADPSRWGPDFLVVAVVVPDCDPEFLSRALALARVGASNSHHVSAYRVVSLLRLLGRRDEAIAALGVADELLATHPPYRSLFEHLAERLFTERMLLGPSPSLG